MTDQSPNETAIKAMHHSHLGTAMTVLQAAEDNLEAQPWYPLQAGDVVLSASAEDVGIGLTYLAEADERSASGVSLRLVSVTGADASDIADEDEHFPFTDLWFDAQPGTLTVIRAGHVVHGAALIVVIPTGGGA